MRKLIIAFALVACATMVNAATVNWSTTKIYQPGTTTAATGYVGYLFEVSSSITVDAVTTAITSGKFNDFAGLALASGTSTSTGSIIKTGLGNYDDQSGTVSWFEVLFDAGNYTAANNYIVSAPVSQTFTSATGSKAASFTNIGTTYNWEPTVVPEPTSGLLLLLGMAGLALRRRRA